MDPRQTSLAGILPCRAEGIRGDWLLRYLPNCLTCLRVALAAAFPFVSQESWLTIIAVALATEFLDGYLARKLDAVSQFGRMADPIADKVFIIAVVATLLWEGVLEPWQLVLVAARDITVLVGIIHTALKQRLGDYRQMHPSFLGKVTTALQFALLVVMVAIPEWFLVTFWMTATVSAIASIDYIGIYNGRKPLIDWQLRHGE